MSRRNMTLLLVALVALAALAVWIFGGFLWPRPQFQRPGAPWTADSTYSLGRIEEARLYPG